MVPSGNREIRSRFRMYSTTTMRFFTGSRGALQQRGGVWAGPNEYRVIVVLHSEKKIARN